MKTELSVKRGLILFRSRMEGGGFSIPIPLEYYQDADENSIYDSSGGGLVDTLLGGSGIAQIRNIISALFQITGEV